MSSIERPIIFSGPMVTACLREIDPKSQTRRVVKDEWQGLPLHEPAYQADALKKCPYGQPGDLLWVRETTAIIGVDGCTVSVARAERMPAGKTLAQTDGGLELIRVTPEEAAWASHRVDPERWRPSIYMPRWACRQLLGVVDVRVERLQEICAADVEAEGLDHHTAAGVTTAESKISAVPEHWIGGSDEGLSYCRPCGEKEIKKLEAKNPGEEYTLDGGYRTEGDGQAFCETCQCYLDNSFTDYACGSELDHFDQYGFDVNSPSDCHSFQNILLASLWKGGKHSDRIRRLSYRALWDSLNAKRGFGWKSNPYVWVISFRRSA